MKLEELPKLREQLQKDIANARYLMGKKKGAWGMTTQADLNRERKIGLLRTKIQHLESKG